MNRTWRNIAVAVLVAILAVAGGLLVWANAILATDTVRIAIAGQASRTLAQPVTIGGISASIFPRVTLNLAEVTIGQPSRIQVNTLHVGTNVRALLSRRIEHGALRLSGVRVELPLPPFGGPASGDAGADAAEESGMPVEIVSIDEIAVSDLEIVSGGRTLRGDIEAVLDGQALVLREVELTAGDATITASGRITDLSAPAGELDVKAGTLNLDQLFAFAGDFAAGSGSSGTPPERSGRGRTGPRGAPGASAMNISLALDAERATMGRLTLEQLTGRARLTPGAVAIDPVAFGLFGGRYEGSLAGDLDGAPAFRWSATLTGIDVAAATAFAGSPNVVSGRLSGKVDVTGRGADAGSAIKSARGTARVDIADGVVRNLGLVRAIVIATSMREGAAGRAASGGSNDEPFTRLGATLAIANGIASTSDLRFESRDLLLSAAGTVRLDASAIDLAGKVQLSDELTKEAGSDLVRYTAEQGRVTLPVAISGPASSPSIRIDVADMAKRAIVNRATEEVKKQLKGLGGLIRKP